MIFEVYISVTLILAWYSALYIAVCYFKEYEENLRPAVNILAMSIVWPIIPAYLAYTKFRKRDVINA